MNRLMVLALFSLITLLYGCGGGASSDTTTPGTPTTTMTTTTTTTTKYAGAGVCATIDENSMFFDKIYCANQPTNETAHMLWGNEGNIVKTWNQELYPGMYPDLRWTVSSAYNVRHCGYVRNEVEIPYDYWFYYVVAGDDGVCSTPDDTFWKVAVWFDYKTPPVQISQSEYPASGSI